ncbi:methyltransferase [Roseovarius sp. SCSIO 43702]|uniref:class I SAM-dependent methyltransferase n=1 Tax=Roseovarius sp. SCSIO 43702 TaxID=2823043 RepID=UPI001C73668C|nr:methyltransferase [Roseovarius sp. SCSIO 43702]QYX57309.1 methyltransferase [Roseovarius sp. SCSIO 43702]
MTGLRLSLALDAGGLTLGDDARVAVLYPTRETDFGALSSERVTVVTGFRPDFEHFERQGYACETALDGTFDAILVCAARSREKTHAAIAEAAGAAPLVIVDGAKTDGIDAVLRACRKRIDVHGPVNKAHGKLFWFDARAESFSDWARGGAREVAPGFVTVPGVFSADGIDPASKALADTLPAAMGRQVADLGAGWGYLAARVLERAEVETLHLVEAEHDALACARRNVEDARAVFHWQDALSWQPDEPLDTVVMNPPFHTGRAADPALGWAFIGAAARVLKPSGHLWMVANRHLPYESALAESFGEVAPVAGDGRFKLFHARRPSRQRG